MKTYKGKAIYQPKGKAAEYSEWACNFYVGCSNGCEYCYLKKGRGSAILGGDKPVLKKCFKDTNHAFTTFKKEFWQNIGELRQHGIFFSFTTDPMLYETMALTLWSVDYARQQGVPVKILTKCASWVQEYLFFLDNSNSDNAKRDWRSSIAFGFTLTGHDELEKGASTDAERIEAMRKLHEAGFKTFASIEPVIDYDSFKMIERCFDFCDLFKVGILSGKKYDKEELGYYIRNVNTFLLLRGKKVYWKDSLLKAAGIKRENMPINCVGRDYNLFEN